MRGQCGQTIVKYLISLWWRSACHQFIECRAKRINIALRSKCTYTTGVILLHRCIAVTETNRLIIHFTAIIVILLAESKVDKHTHPLAVKQNIPRLNIEVAYFMFVNITNRLGYLSDVSNCVGLGKHTATLYKVAKRATTVVLHHIVCSVILGENIAYADDIPMLELRDHTCSLNKLLHIAMYYVFSIQSNVICCSIALAALHKEILHYAHFAPQQHLRSKVGDFKTILSQHAFYFIFSSLKESTCG